MKIYLIFIILCIHTLYSHSGYTDEEVDHYEQLITEEIQKSSTYQFPKDASEYIPTNSDPIDFGLFDFIIIGGGSAGSVVASRLSEVKQWNVLLLEAGKKGNSFTDIPSMSAFTMSSNYNWGFNSTRQTTCCLNNGGICPFPQGKGLGGTSLLNALIYVRGNRLDYDKWEQLGNPGWSYEDVLPYFIKSENSNIKGEKDYHGSGGYLNVEYHNPTSKRIDLFLEAHIDQGRSVLDYNGKEQIGAGRVQLTTSKGRRLTSAKAFLNPASKRINLKILTDSYVTKIVISNATMKANAVLFSHRNKLYTVRVKKEVILSAGVVGSPQILMHSGVGPKNHLNRVHIPLIKDLAVGENLHDHATLFSNYFLTFHYETSVGLREGIKQFLNGTGPLTISTNPQAVSFYKLGLTDYGVPDMEIVMVPAVQSGGFDVNKRGAVHGYVDENYWGRSITQNHVFQLVLVLLHPRTRGRIYLNSNNPYEYPVIESRCLADPENKDIEGVYKGVQALLQLVSTESFKQLKPIIIPYKNCLHNGFLTKTYWTCLIRQTLMNAYHGGGTCQMGSEPRKGAVVNNKLKVHGIENIRVADSSVVPITLSAHMNAPAIMIGERVADFVKENYNVTKK